MRAISLFLARGARLGSRIVLAGVVPGFALLTAVIGLVCSVLWAVGIGRGYDLPTEHIGLERFSPYYYATWPALHAFAIAFGIIGRSENRNRRGPLCVSQAGILIGGLGVTVWAVCVVYAFILVLRGLVGI